MDGGGEGEAWLFWWNSYVNWCKWLYDVKISASRAKSVVIFSFLGASETQGR